MKPDLEVVTVQDSESFKAWEHGYPFRTVRWHFHPEYEIQLIVETAGQYFVGDYVGRFSPGNLVFMAPNLPHNWVSEVPEGESVERRNLIVQFSGDFLFNRVLAFPEFRHLQSLVDQSKRGVIFSNATAELAKPIMEELINAKQSRRIVLFLALLDLIGKDLDCRLLASHNYSPDPGSYMSQAINQVLAYISDNITSDLREAEIAEMFGQSISGFSRAFRKHAGMTFIQHINSLRILRACELLTETKLSIADICFQIGYNNVSNFNRHFLLQKGVPPSRFRSLHRLNVMLTSA